MKLVIDTNNIIAALIKNGISRRIIISPVIELITPDHTLQEISKYEKLICNKAKLSSNEFKLLMIRGNWTSLSYLAGFLTIIL